MKTKQFNTFSSTANQLDQEWTSNKGAQTLKHTAHRLYHTVNRSSRFNERATLAIGAVVLHLEEDGKFASSSTHKLSSENTDNKIASVVKIYGVGGLESIGFTVTDKLMSVKQFSRCVTIQMKQPTESTVKI